MLFRSDVAYFNTLISKPFEAKSYPLTEFSIEEAQSIFAGQNITPTQLKDIRTLCGGMPGRMASLSRSISFGTDVQQVIDEMHHTRPEFFSIEWKQVADTDNVLKSILAVLALDAKPHSTKVLAEILRIDSAVVEEKLRALNFISIDQETKYVHFASAGYGIS